MKDAIIMGSLFLTITMVGCEQSSNKSTPQESANPTAPGTLKDAHESVEENDHGDHDNHAPKDEGRGAGHGGEVVELGSAMLGTFNVRASRDDVEFKAGGDAPIDVWIDGGVGKGVTAVRFWIGVENAKGSMKAKAGVER